ncbi:hypothetical protein G7Z17_g12933 [Cylindrodendrum hubeiense]|uniref:Nucleotide-diphospho-sugar transferase domain-containing protein n=1 Tax=Cylindrodendrum hubeiense TaxID=595255 RepID=A0A9P5LA36_9HYPO|nr:hypothetical protein G7Z17_g12933 [Cylindrodendrum hubeiense]
MSALRSNRAALLTVAFFFIVFMGLAHFHLSNPSFTNATDDVADVVPAIPEKEVAATTLALDDSASKLIDPPTAATNKPDKPTKTPANKPAEPTDVQVEQPEEPDATLAPATADVSVFRPQQWVFPAVKPDSPEYAPYGHWPFKLPENNKPHWTQPLGKRLCIIDLESRRFDKPGELWSDSMTWNRSSEVHGPSGGTLNHWAYAKIHGYQYYYVKINTYTDRRDSWKKPSVLAKILKKHDTCVFIDSDAMFNHLDLPLEWLMNYWKISPTNNSLALATDPDTQHNRNRVGDLFLNTGFMIMQNNNQTYKMFKEWDECADDGGKYPECVEFRNRKGWQPTDQGGFGTFTRYDYAKDIIELSCDEANGFPESNTGCNGKFIKHVWLGKEDRLVLAVGAVFPGVLLETFHRQFLEEKDTFYTTEDKLVAGG